MCEPIYWGELADTFRELSFTLFFYILIVGTVFWLVVGTVWELIELRAKRAPRRAGSEAETENTRSNAP